VCERLKEAWVDLQGLEGLEDGDPFLERAWDEYVTARADAESAFTDLTHELAGVYVLARIEGVSVDVLG
jgi:hypothetical protein